MNEKEVHVVLSDRKIVKMSNDLNSARFKMSPLALDILHLFVAQVKKEDKEFKQFEISVKDMEKKLGKRVNVDYLDKVTNELFLPFKLYENGSWEKYSWCSKVSFKNNRLTFEMHEDLKNKIINLPNNYVLFNMQETTKLSNFNLKRLYTLLKQFENSGWYEISVEELIAILDAQKQFKRYTDLKRYLLEPAIKQINEKTDLSFKYEEIKSGRKVARIKFTMQIPAKVIKSKKAVTKPKEDKSSNEALKEFYFNSVNE